MVLNMAIKENREIAKNCDKMDSRKEDRMIHEHNEKKYLCGVCQFCGVEGCVECEQPMFSHCGYGYHEKCMVKA